MKKIIFIALALVIAVYLLCLANEKRPSQKPEENESLHSENWKEYERLVDIWPQLKKEGIESIRFCNAISLEYGYDIVSDFGEDVGPSGFRERVANVVRWWPCRYKVPKENLPECIKIIDGAMKDAKKAYWSVSSREKMLIVTKKGRYIVRVVVIPLEEVGPQAHGEEWMSRELGGFIVKYCIPFCKRCCSIPLKEQTAAILIFTERKYDPTKDFGAHDSRLSWPPIALFGDKKEAEKLLGRSFEPKMVFEGRDWLEKIITEYEIALKNAEETHYQKVDSSTIKGWVVFLTQDEFYWRGIGIDENSVFEDYMMGSRKLKAYFDELGLTKELLAGEPNARREASQGE